MKVFSTPLNSDLMPLFANAAKIAGKDDRAGVYDLCRRLTGIDTIKYMKACPRVRGLFLPSGYMHVRFFDEADLSQFASIFAMKPSRKIHAEEIIVHVFMSEKFTNNHWLATVPMFDHFHSAKGVLDLALRFKPRAKPLDRYDID